MNHGARGEYFYNHCFFTMYRSTIFLCQAKNGGPCHLQNIESLSSPTQPKPETIYPKIDIDSIQFPLSLDGRGLG
ncbi:MAG: hypothetical protein A2157_03955 [Deltaproteobacteria bacterium RBG_16_47_11]|nr:MAG: hypothetical protein A2157_03955 [Deltaproteobacteria bacterium RBG_16_47_11]